MASEGLTDRGNTTILPDGRIAVMRLREMAAACAIGWDDALGDISQSISDAALTQEAYRDTAHRMYFFDYTKDEVISFRFQFPHRWNRGEVRPHIHWIPMVSPAAPQNVQFAYSYAWGDVGVIVPANVGWISAEVPAAVGVADGFKPQITSLVSITPPATAKESSFLLFTVKRLGLSSAADTYETPKVGGTITANVGLLAVDVHFQADQLGTFTEIPV
jgi:hypothetical protein